MGKLFRVSSLIIYEFKESGLFFINLPYLTLFVLYIREKYLVEAGNLVSSR